MTCGVHGRDAPAHGSVPAATTLLQGETYWEDGGLTMHISTGEIHHREGEVRLGVCTWHGNAHHEP